MDRPKVVLGLVTNWVGYADWLEIENDILRKALETLHVRSQKMSPLDSAWVEDVCWDALEDKR
jgi:hypothetical protein